jgi:hypothetical protein
VFRRKSAESTVVDAPSLVKEVGKGRATPKRREVEAANKARAKTPAGRKERAAAQRSQRTESSARMREAMKTGDERYLPARDRGPVKRFVRDWIDSHFLVAEIILPLLIIALVLGYVGNRDLAVIGELVVLLLILVVVVSSVIMRFALRRELARRFPGQSYQGVTYYAIMRSLQVRFLRMPKPQVKMGDTLRDTYR